MTAAEETSGVVHLIVCQVELRKIVQGLQATDAVNGVFRQIKVLEKAKRFQVLDAHQRYGRMSMVEVWLPSLESRKHKQQNRRDTSHT